MGRWREASQRKCNAVPVWQRLRLCLCLISWDGTTGTAQHRIPVACAIDPNSGSHPFGPSRAWPPWRAAANSAAPLRHKPRFRELLEPATASTASTAPGARRGARAWTGSFTTQAGPPGSSFPSPVVLAFAEDADLHVARAVTALAVQRTRARKPPILPRCPNRPAEFADRPGARPWMAPPRTLDCVATLSKPPGFHSFRAPSQPHLECPRRPCLPRRDRL